MNVDTGEVRALMAAQSAAGSAAVEVPPGFEVLPPTLNRAARRAINRGGQVDLAGRSSLAAWAREQRRNR